MGDGYYDGCAILYGRGGTEYDKRDIDYDERDGVYEEGEKDYVRRDMNYDEGEALKPRVKISFFYFSTTNFTPAF